MTKIYPFEVTDIRFQVDHVNSKNTNYLKNTKQILITFILKLDFLLYKWDVGNYKWCQMEKQFLKLKLFKLTKLN